MRAIIRATPEFVVAESHSLRRGGLAHALLGLSLVLCAVSAPVATLAAQCNVNLVRVSTIGDEDGPGVVGTTRVLTRGPDGTVYTTGGIFPGVVQTFDSAGRFSGSIGRLGDGPGEFRAISAVLPTGTDTFVLIDNAHRRASVMKRDIGLVRSYSIPGGVFPAGGAMLTSGRLLLNANVAERSTVGLPLHVVSSQGTLLRSFGSVEGYYLAPDLLGASRQMAVVDSEYVWTARRSPYVLELWSVKSGERVRGYSPQRQWWQPDENTGLLSPEHTPPSRVQGIYYDPSVPALVVAINVAGSNWRSALVRQEEREGTYWLPRDWGAVHNTIIEAIDPRSGALLGSRRIPAYVRGVASTGYVFSYRQDDIEVDRMDLWRVTLENCRG